jgi:hypothetical protein
MDQVGQTPGRVGKGAGRSAQLLGWSARFWGSSARALVATRLHEEEKPESVEKDGGGHSKWLADHVAWQASHHLAPDRPL